MVALWTLAFLLQAQQAQPQRSVAVTLDDLPWAQHGPGPCDAAQLMEMTRAILKPVREMHVPVTAFVIGSNCANLTLEQRRAALRLWQDAGVELGNHTFSHHSYNTMSIEEYEADIVKGEASLRESIGAPDSAHIQWFRSPMLQTGDTAAKQSALDAFLAAHRWRQAMVTFDNSDWMFAYVYRDAVQRGDRELAARVREAYVPYLESVIDFFEKRSVEVVGHEFPQVLLLHAHSLNAEKLGDVLRMLQRRGYTFVSLATAMNDPAYALPNTSVSKGGFSWIHRWSKTMGLPGKGEPDEPAWITKQYEAISRAGR